MEVVEAKSWQCCFYPPPSTLMYLAGAGNSSSLHKVLITTRPCICSFAICICIRALARVCVCDRLPVTLHTTHTHKYCLATIPHSSHGLTVATTMVHTPKSFPLHHLAPLLQPPGFTLWLHLTNCSESTELLMMGCQPHCCIATQICAPCSLPFQVSEKLHLGGHPTPHPHPSEDHPSREPHTAAPQHSSPAQEHADEGAVAAQRGTKPFPEPPTEPATAGTTVSFSPLLALQ